MVVFSDLPLGDALAQKLKGLHTLELATFLGACKAYYDRGLKGMVSINSFPSECFDEEESEAFFRCFPDVAKYMIVEILEYTDLDYDKWILKREQIRSHDIHIALDDYGSGTNCAMAVNSFHDKGVRVLAEGIEYKEELDFILTTDVDYLQGYYLGMPE